MALTALVVALALSPAPSLSPALSDGDVEQARALVAEGLYDDAIDLLRSSLEANPADIDLVVALAEAQRQSGRPAAAIDTLATLDDDGYATSLARGQAYIDRAAEAKARANNEDAQFYALDAKTHFEQALASAPDGDHRARVSLGFLNLYELGDYRSAYDLAEGGLTTTPDDAELRLLRGCAGVYVYYYASQGGGDEAAAHDAWKTSVEDLTAANEALPKERVEPLGQLCYMYDQKGLPHKAVDAAIELYDRQPTFDTLYFYAKKYADARQLEPSAKALEKIVSSSARDLTRMIAAEPDKNAVAESLHYSVTPLMNRNDVGTARSILSAIVSAQPQVPVVWNNYGVVCENARRYDDAIEAYETSLEIDPNQARAHNDLAAILHHFLDKDLDRAKELYQRCIDLAEEQLADESLELTATARAELNDARQVARDNLGQLQPKSSLLDSMLEGVRNLDLPELDGDDDTDGGGL